MEDLEDEAMMVHAELEGDEEVAPYPSLGGG